MYWKVASLVLTVSWAVMDDDFWMLAAVRHENYFPIRRIRTIIDIEFTNWR